MSRNHAAHLNSVELRSWSASNSAELRALAQAVEHIFQGGSEQIPVFAQSAFEKLEVCQRLPEAPDAVVEGYLQDAYFLLRRGLFALGDSGDLEGEGGQLASRGIAVLQEALTRLPRRS